MFWILLLKTVNCQNRPVVNQNYFTFNYNGVTYSYNIATLQNTLTSQPDHVVTTDGYDYYYNIGGGLLSTTCPAPSCSNSFFAPVSDITVCPLMQNSGYYYYCLGSANFMVASLISADPTVTGNGLKLTYSNGQICGLSYRKAVFNLYCDQTRTSGNPAFISQTENPVCTYNMNFKALEGCYYIDSNPSSKSTNSSSSSNSSNIDSGLLSSSSQTLLIEIVAGVAFVLILGFIWIMVIRTRNLRKNAASLKTNVGMNTNIGVVTDTNTITNIPHAATSYGSSYKTSYPNKSLPRPFPSDPSRPIAANTNIFDRTQNQFPPTNLYYDKNSANYSTGQAAFGQTMSYGVGFNGYYPPGQYYPNQSSQFKSHSMVPPKSVSSPNSGQYSTSAHGSNVPLNLGNSGSISHYSQGFGSNSHSTINHTPLLSSSSSNFVSSQLNQTHLLNAQAEQTLPTDSGRTTTTWQDAETVKTARQNDMIMALPGHLQVSDKEYRIEKKIGAGGGGDIFHTSLLAANPDLNSRVGDRKIIAKVMKSAGEKMFVQEVSIMAMFHSHKNYAEFVGFDKPNMTMLMIFYPKGSFDKMVSQKQRSLKILFNIIMGTFNAITDLHKCGIVHNDIKSANILLFEEPDGIITPKLTDFGIAQVVENITLLVTAFEVKSIRGFSLRYAAPERLSKKFTVSPWDKIRVAKSADTYSMGITIWESLCGDKPLF